MLIGYARVSTLDQNLDLQLDALRAAGCEKIFTDAASGALKDRPGLQEAIAYARKGDTLVAWKLDRFGRSLKNLIELINSLADRGVGFRSLQESLDTTSSAGKLIFHIFGALAEFERDLIQERTKAGLAAARARGRQGGRRRVMSDADIAMAKTLMANSEISIKDICTKLGVSKATLYRNVPTRR